MDKTGMTLNELFAHQVKTGIVPKTDNHKHLFQLVKRNLSLLDGCELHDFSVELGDNIATRKYECTNCGGEVDRSTKSWYEKGLSHGKIYRECITETL